jgi:hypothetical protein
MGLSFHYSGSIANPELLPKLIEDIEDIAKVYNWKHNVYERQFPVHLFGKPDYNRKIYGINFTPTNCESISVSFLSNGRMSDHAHLEFYGKTENQPEREFLYMLSVKTQYAGVETHKFIIQLFRYLNTKYFADFKMSDEGHYWETNDETLLESTFKTYTDLIKGFTTAFQNYPIQPGENIESYFERLMKQIGDHKRRG